MEPELVLRREIDPLTHSPLVRGLALSMSYADEQGAIGLTKSGAMNRKFVHWAAEQFNWPGYSRDELFLMNKVLNEIGMPPLWPVHDLLLHLKLMHRYKGATVQLMKTLYGWEKDDRDDPGYQQTSFALKFCIIRPLCWLGLLWEDREGLSFFDEGTFYKAPLWSAALALESDAQAELRLI